MRYILLKLKTMKYILIITVILAFGCKEHEKVGLVKRKYTTAYYDNKGLIAQVDTSGTIVIFDDARLLALFDTIQSINYKRVTKLQYDYWKPVVVIIGLDTSYLRRDTLRFEECGADIRMASLNG